MHQGLIIINQLIIIRSIPFIDTDLDLVWWFWFNDPQLAKKPPNIGSFWKYSFCAVFPSLHKFFAGEASLTCWVLYRGSFRDGFLQDYIQARNEKKQERDPLSTKILKFRYNLSNSTYTLIFEALVLTSGKAKNFPYSYTNCWSHDFQDETETREGQVLFPRITEELETWKEFLALWLKHQFVLAHLNCCHVCKPTAPRQVDSYDISNPGNIIK